MKWIRQFLILLLVTFLGELCRYLIPLPIPSGIYGLILMFAALMTHLVKLEQVETAADFLVEIMPFFFIPAGVGLMTKWAELKSMLLPFLVAVLLITVIVMIVTGKVTQSIMKHKHRKEGHTNE